MKHFSISDPKTADQARPFEREDDDAMTQEGFKKFRRRRSRAQAEAEQSRFNTQAEPTVAKPTSPHASAPRANAPQKLTAASLASSASSAGTTPVQQKAPLAKAVEPKAAKAKVDPPHAAPVRVSRVATKSPEPPKTPPPRETQSRLPTRFDPWLQLPEIPFDFLGQRPSRLPLVSAFRASPTARAFDLLRTRLMHSLKDHGWKRVAVTSPAAGGGTTFCAVNLALSLARVPGSRTVLMDLNFRNPGVAAALGIPASGNMVDFLSGSVAMSDHLRRLSDSLAVGTNLEADQNASDILHDRRTADVLEDMIEDSGADTVLFDLPPVLAHDDVTAFLPQVDGVLLISDGDHTTAAQLAACEKMLAGHAPLLGVVLNRAQQTDKTQVTA